MPDSRGRQTGVRRAVVLAVVVVAMLAVLAVWVRPRAVTWWFVRKYPARGCTAVEASRYAALWHELRRTAESAGSPRPDEVVRVREVQHPSVLRTDKVGITYFSLLETSYLGANMSFEEVVGRAGQKPQSLWTMLTMSRKEFATYRWRAYPVFQGEALSSEAGPNRFVMFCMDDFTILVQIWSPDGAWVETNRYACREKGKDEVEECLKWLAGYLRVIEF